MKIQPEGNVGVLEYWSVGKREENCPEAFFRLATINGVELSLRSSTPLLQHSITPLWFLSPRLPL